MHWPRGQKVKGQGHCYENRHGRTVASNVFWLCSVLSHWDVDLLFCHFFVFILLVFVYAGLCCFSFFRISCFVAVVHLRRRRIKLNFTDALTPLAFPHKFGCVRPRNAGWHIRWVPGFGTCAFSLLYPSVAVTGYLSVRWWTGHASELERTSAAAEAEERGRVGRRESELGRGRLQHGQRSWCERTGRGGSRRHGGAQR